MHTIKTRASDKCICSYICEHQKGTGEGITSSSGGLAQQYCSGCAASGTRFFTCGCEMGGGCKCCEHEVYTLNTVCTRCCVHQVPYAQKAISSSQPEQSRQKGWRNGYNLVPLLEGRD